MLKGRYEEISNREYVEQLLFRLVSDESNSADAVVFYGRLGIGKSTLCKALYNQVTESGLYSTIINGTEILNNYVISSSANAALFELGKCLLKNNSDISSFEIIYLLYQALTNSSIAQENQILPIIEVVKKGLYQFPLLEYTKIFGSNSNKREFESVLLGDKIFSCLNWFFIQQTETIRQWWKLRGSQYLQELKDCANLQEILELLPILLARDLQLHFSESRKKAVIFIDNYEYLTDAGNKCNWLKDLINLVKPSSGILWVVFAEKPVDLTNHTQNIPLQSLTDSQCKAIVQKSGINNLEISQLIIQASGGIPLYLHLGIETYLSLVKQKTPHIEDFGDNISEIVPQLNAAWDWYEQRIWQILSNCDSWDEVLFAKLMSQFEIANCNWICDCWGKLFHKVVKSPFVESNSQGFCLHPIVGKYLYHNQPENLLQSVNCWLYEYYQSDTSGELRLTQLQLTLVKLLEHGLNQQQQVGKHQFSAVMLQSLLKYQQNALLFALLGKSLSALGDYEQAIIALETALSLWDADIEKNLVATVELHLAICYLKVLRNADADRAAKNAFHIRTTQLDRNSIEIAEVLNIQVEIAVLKKNYSEALKLSQQALQILESHQNVELQLAQTKFTTAWLNAIAKNLDTASKQFKQTLDILHLADRNHPLGFFCHEMLGNIYQKMGYFRYQQADEEYKLALETAEISLGLTHPQTLQLITGIINFSRIRGEYDTVDILTQRRHANMEISNFEETPAAADRLNKMGCLLYQQGNFACSENLLQQALKINCKILSEQHPQTAESFHNLGLIYKSQKRYDIAQGCFEQALQIRSQMLGEEHPTTANSLNSLAALYCCMGKYSQAEPLLQQALKICQNKFGEMHPHTATTLNNLAQMYLCQGIKAKAEPIFQQALDICIAVLGKEHSHTKTVQSNLNRLHNEGDRGIGEFN